MNKTDIKNIKKEIKKREASDYQWINGGELTREQIESKSLNELNELVNSFTEGTFNNAAIKAKEIIDRLFAKYGEDDDNMIALYAANCPERSTYGCGQGLDIVDFNDDKYNKLYKPICRKWEGLNYWSRSKMSDKEIQEWDAKWAEYDNDMKPLYNLLNDLKIPTAEYYWREDNEALNECWYGVIGIMKDYRVVSFVIRDDGMLCDEEGYETFYNSVLQQL